GWLTQERRVVVRVALQVAGGALGILAALAWAGAPQEKAKEAKPRYVGVANCKLCHSEAETGNQFEQWKKSKHSEALKTLSTPRAKEVGAKAGVAEPAKDARCLRCHVTAVELPREMKMRTFKDADAIGCESCHGPGEFYAKEEVFKKGREAALAAGLILPDEKLCRRCHNQESPTYKEFDFKARLELVKHPNPKKKK
ncbi:MAG: multiheme c-type cytochrome, partial [Anaerolineales bacterium]